MNLKNLIQKENLSYTMAKHIKDKWFIGDWKNDKKA